MTAAPRPTDAEALRECARITAGAGSNFYLAFLPMPRDRREGIFSVYAFCRVVDDAVDEPEPGTDPAREIARWRERVHAITRRRELPDDHPVARGLRGDDLDAVLDGVEMDLGRTRYATAGELALYCERVAGRVGCLCLPVFGATDRARGFALALGHAFQLTNILRDVAKDAASGRLYLPLDDLARHGVAESDVMAGRETPALRALRLDLCDRAEALFDEADRLLEPDDRPVLYPALIMTAIYRRLLDALRASEAGASRVRLAAPVKALLALGVYGRDRFLQTW
jgi:phytoene synthase